MIIAIGIPLLYVAFFSVTNLPAWLNFKPFNCNICLSFWTIVFIYAGGLAFYGIMEAGYVLALGGIAAYTAMIAKRIYFKI